MSMRSFVRCTNAWGWVISSLSERYKLIESDFRRYGQFLGWLDQGFEGKIKITVWALRGVNRSFTYSFWLRLAHMDNILGRVARRIHSKLSRKWAVETPYQCKIGKGFYIGHCYAIVINDKTIIGDFVNISQFLTIGSNHGTPATVGSHVYIGPNVCIVEDVKIGNHVKIGAGTVVVNNIPSFSTSVGNPNRVISRPGVKVIEE